MAPIDKAIQLAVSKRFPRGLLHLRCHVTPGTNKSREGVEAVTPRLVEISVAALPKDGESNKAVIRVLSEALDVRVSDISIVKGLRSRDKLMAVDASRAHGTGQEALEKVQTLLVQSARNAAPRRS